MMQSTYDHDTANRYRYTLGTCSKNCLFVIGVNPSTATNTHLDPTLKNVNTFSKILGFDSFIMLNLYPQRATLPKNLHKRFNQQQHKMNLQFIKKYICPKPTIWAAWGDLIEIRPYLFEALNDIHKLLKPVDPHWIQYGNPTIKGHPKHPSRKKHVNCFTDFDLDAYIASR